MPTNDNPVVVTTKGNKPTASEVKEDEIKKRTERIAKLTQVLSRGFVAERARVDLPDDIHGEWVANNAVAIARKEAIGFQIDTEHATKNKSVHSDGTNKAIIGDVIHMTTSMENYEDLVIAQEYELARRRAKPGDNIEEESFINGLLTDTGGDISGSHESKLHKATAQDVTDAIRSAKK